MKAAMQDFVDSIDHSRMYESQCKPRGPSPGPAPKPTGGFELQVAAGKAVKGECLTIQGLEKHAVVVIGSCDAGSRWSNASGQLTNLADSSLCLKVDAANNKKPCAQGNTIWMGACKGNGNNGFTIDSKGHLVSELCPGLCAVPATQQEVFIYSSAAIALGDCSSPDAFLFTKNETSSQLEIVL